MTALYLAGSALDELDQAQAELDDHCPVAAMADACAVTRKLLAAQPMRTSHRPTPLGSGFSLRRSRP